MREKSFTLIELLIVLIIIAALTGALMPLFRTNRYEAQKAKVLIDFEAIKTASNLMHLDTGSWPLYEFVDNCLGNNFSTHSSSGLLYNKDFYDNPIPNWNGPYLNEWKIDPWGTEYWFVYSGIGTNTIYLHVLSEGPNCQFDSLFEANGLILLGDDIAMLIATINPTP